MAKQAMLATVHILINVDAADKNAAEQSSDVLRTLLTDNGLLRGAILDWSFLASPDGDLHYPYPIKIPDDYDRDETALPYIDTVPRHTVRPSRNILSGTPMIGFSFQPISIWERTKHVAKRAQQVLASFF